MHKYSQTTALYHITEFIYYYPKSIILKINIYYATTTTVNMKLNTKETRTGTDLFMELTARVDKL